MDKLRAALPRFLEKLERFNNRLEESAADVEQAREKLGRVGDDDFLREFDQRLRKLREPVERYRQRAPRLEQAVREKIVIVERYFRG